MTTFDETTVKNRLLRAVDNQRRLRQRVARSPGDIELEETPESPVIEQDEPLAFDIDAP